MLRWFMTRRLMPAVVIMGLELRPNPVMVAGEGKP